MKQSIAWHTEVLRNVTESVRREREELVRRMASLEDSNKRLTFCTMQLSEAIRLKKDGYDSDKFLVKKAQASKPVAEPGEPSSRDDGYIGYRAAVANVPQDRGRAEKCLGVL